MSDPMIAVGNLSLALNEVAALVASQAKEIERLRGLLLEIRERDDLPDHLTARVDAALGVNTVQPQEATSESQ